jgi:hypothetical protein
VQECLHLSAAEASRISEFRKSEFEMFEIFWMTRKAESEKELAEQGKHWK